MLFHRLFLVLVGSTVFASTFLIAHEASADDVPTLAGRWQATKMVSRWRIGQWGEACGPKPSGGGAPAATVNIEQVGKELSITGGGRTYSTSSCWQQFPGIRRVSHSAGSRFWQSVCKSPSNDPRQTTLTTRISATDTSISFEETGQYQFVIKGQNCTASSGHWRTFRLIQRTGEPPLAELRAKEQEKPAEKPEPKKEAPTTEDLSKCKTRGEPARLEVRPARKLMLVGDTFRFDTAVLDDKGCRVQSNVTFSVVTPHDGVEVAPGGNISIAEGTEEGEVTLQASASGKSVPVTIEIASKERFDALLAAGTFNEAGESTEAAAVAIASQSVGAETAVAEDSAKFRKNLFAILVGSIALVLSLGGIAVVVVARRRRRQLEEANDAAHEQAMAEYEMARAEAERKRAEYEEQKRQAASPPKQKVCPKCGRMYPPETAFCGEDGTNLVPVN